jgi:hypothetical protein
MPLLFTVFWIAAAAGLADEAAKPFVQVTLEHQSGSEWTGVDPRTVLASGEKIRFRFTTSFSGYLYVFNRASDGSTDKLYPNGDSDNHVEPGQTYRIPASGDYVVDGPPGFDITHWIVTTEPLSTLPTVGDLPQSDLPNTLIPRCREGGLRPRGGPGCLDDHAGPQPTKDSGKLNAETLKPRNIRLDKGDSKITAPSARPSVLIYEFRVAHK